MMKKLFIKLLPRFMINVLVKIKYRKYNIEKHTYNIENKLLAEVRLINKTRYVLLKNIFKKSSGGVVNINNHRVYFHPVAIIKVPDNIEKYLKEIGAKSRNMIVKAIKNNISCKKFDWNEYLEDIYDINTSLPYRQGRKMDNSYKQYPAKVENKIEDDFYITFIGAFKQEKLIGYVELYIYGNFAMINRILGHGEYLNTGVMNLLIKSCVEYAIDNKIEYINYLTMQNKDSNSLSAFKKRVGFREYSLLELK